MYFLYDQSMILVNKPIQGTEEKNQNSILLKLKKKMHSLLGIFQLIQHELSADMGSYMFHIG